MFHVRYSVKKSRCWEEAVFEKEKKRVYCTIRMIFYILIFICSFIFYSKYPVFLITVAIVRREGTKWALPL